MAFGNVVQDTLSQSTCRLNASRMTSKEISSGDCTTTKSAGLTSDMPEQTSPERQMSSNASLDQQPARQDLSQASTAATKSGPVTAPPPLPALPSTWTNDYEVVPECPVIGAGAYATVFQVRHKLARTCFACKVIQRHFLEIRGMGAQIAAEIQCMQYASASCRVAKLLGAAEEAGCIFLLMELCPFGNLGHELAAQPSGYLPEDRARRCSRHILQALMDLHGMGIMHRDVKLENILVSTGQSLKLTDFGWAASSQASCNDLAGTLHTMAPEVLRGETQTSAIDIWSAGAVIFQIVTGRPLLNSDIGPGSTQLTHCDYQEATNIRKERLLEEMTRTCSPLAESMRPAHVSPLCWDLLGRLLDMDPLKRASAAEALQHDWLLVPDVTTAQVVPDALSSTVRKESGSTPLTATPRSSMGSSSVSSEAEES